ncbi:hypothetical protein SPRG_14546 [Saprolegnia parasitica CBS 223.65]|uniref:Uncharacterized protein n=1 Tax=Saprolegnia parasitica (strain CBS 223.65) TaxID=695850 RepID=A0A067BZB4_SAPPC|nr:hypothetical protein SPRG_14546 [Saprolegnia parasitica CBS 223.65]KDO19646.1 hypothetical protein SPRG_14546 [Saprolegnia parasitica CBS 223.65]|eukprot:XP_012209646.1 hypothetical protein SPRG_14546 [Saprolegnia parasitica CBS 223.65]
MRRDSAAADKRRRRTSAVHVTADESTPGADESPKVGSEPSLTRASTKCANGASLSGTISESVAKENQALRDEIKGLRHSIEFHTHRADQAEASLLTLQAELSDIHRRKEEALQLKITALQAELTASTEANETQMREFQAQKAVIEQSFRDRIEAMDAKVISQTFSSKAVTTMPTDPLHYDPATGANYCALPPRKYKGSSAMIKELLTSGAADTNGDAAIMTSILANAQAHSQRVLCRREE